MDDLPTPETLVTPTSPMDASEALYLDTLCDRRDAALLSPFTDAEGLLADEEEAGAVPAQTPAPATPN